MKNPTKIPDAWRVVDLGEIADFINGDRGKNYPSQKDFAANGIPFINAGHIQDGNISSDSMNFIGRDRFDLLSSGKVNLNDILYCLRGSLGKCAIVRDIEEGAVASSLVIIRPSKEVTTNYLYRYLISPIGQAQIKRFDNGSTQPNLSAKSVKEFEIPLPPIDEQRRIAAILDKADAVRRKRKNAIALTEDLLRSAFLEMFGDPVTNPKGWARKPLGKVAKFLGGGTPSRKRADYFDGDICWASSKDMSVDVLTDTQEHITEDAIENSSTKLVDQECLLIVVKSKILMRRLPVARVTVPICFNQDIKAIVPDQDWMTRYVHRHLLFGEKVLLQQARGANTEGLTLDHLRTFPMMMPPQSSIKSFVELDIHLERTTKRNESLLNESDSLFNSLLQRAFQGDL